MKTYFLWLLWLVSLVVNAQNPAQKFSDKMKEKGGLGLTTNDFSNAAKSKLDSIVSPFSRLDVTLPAGLGWDATAHPLGYVGIYDTPGFNRAVGEIGVTPEQIFDAYSTARSAPGSTFYVDVTTGNDSDNGSTDELAFRSIGKAILAANAAGVPTRIYVKSGTYYRTINPSFNSSSGIGNIVPTVDIALIATNGRVVTGTFEDITRLPSFAADGTYSNTYSCIATVSNGGTDGFDRVVDLYNLNEYGNYTELVYVATPALCNITPNSWTNELVNSNTQQKIYINRADKKAVTIQGNASPNTRIFRAGDQTYTLRLTNGTSLYVGGIDARSGFDFEGGGKTQSNGQGGGPLTYVTGAPTSTKKAVVFDRCSAKYSGGRVNDGGVGFGVDNLNGIAAFFNCRADANQTDGFNAHVHLSTFVASGYKMHFLTVNCTAYDNGRDRNQSCQGLTIHNSVVGIDVAGHYKGNRGGNVRHINETKSLSAGTYTEVDNGDGQFTPPAGFQFDDSAEGYLFRCKTNMPAATFGIYANNVSIVYLRQMWPSGRPNAGTGTFLVF